MHFNNVTGKNNKPITIDDLLSIAEDLNKPFIEFFKECGADYKRGDVLVFNEDDVKQFVFDENHIMSALYNKRRVCLDNAVKSKSYLIINGDKVIFDIANGSFRVELPKDA